MEVIKDSTGQHKRVVIQIEPQNKTVITTLQKSVGAGFEGFQDYNLADTHLTLFHFGKPQELYSEIMRYSPSKIDYSQFYADFIGLLDQLDTFKKSDPISMVGEEIALFDYPTESNKKFGVVLLFDKSAQLIALREKLLRHIDNWLTVLGLTDHKRFYKESLNFKHNLPEDYNAHITLGRVFGLDMPTNYKSKVEPTKIVFDNLNFLNTVSGTVG